MDKKVVLVTGSSRGIGYSTILEFASHNYNVVINYNNSKSEALALQKEVEEKYKIKALVVKCDISDEVEINNMIDKIITEFGKIDVLVNNAGIAIDTEFALKTKENFMKILEVNLVGTFLVSKAVGNYMLKQKSGSIVNIASTNAIDTYYTESLDYDASKAGIISLTRNLALNYAPYIRVNAVLPGWINTDMNRNLDKSFIDKENEKTLLGRFGEAEEVAKTIYFISEEATYINNTIIRVDGGFCGNR